jgi:hypothetical protein
VQPGDTDVHHGPGRATEVGGGEFRLAGDGQVGRTGRDHHDEPAGGGGNRRGPGQQPGLGIVEGVAEFGPDRRGVLGTRPGEQGGRRRTGTRREGPGDRPDLAGCLALAVHGLGVAAAVHPVVVQVGDLVERAQRFGVSHAGR